MGMSGTVLLLALLASLPYTWLHCLMMEAGSLTNLQVCHSTACHSPKQLCKLFVHAHFMLLRASCCGDYTVEEPTACFRH